MGKYSLRCFLSLSSAHEERTKRERGQSSKRPSQFLPSSPRRELTHFTGSCTHPKTRVSECMYRTQTKRRHTQSVCMCACASKQHHTSTDEKRNVCARGMAERTGLLVDYNFLRWTGARGRHLSAVQSPLPYRDPHLIENTPPRNR